MKKILIFCAVLFSSILKAQDPAAKSFLEKSLSEISKKSFQCFFLIKNRNAATDETREQKGTLKLKGQKFFFAGADIELFYNGKTQWLYQPSIQEVALSEPSSAELAQINPLLMISKITKTHRANFDADDNPAAEVRLLNLYPSDLNSDYFRVAIKITAKTRLPQEISLFFKNGTSTTFLLKEIIEKPQFTDADFIFDEKKYKNVYINDLR